MSNILFVGSEYEDFLKSPASLRYRESLLRESLLINNLNFNNICKEIDMFRMFGIRNIAEIDSIYRDESEIDIINKLFFRELISEQIGFANCFLSDNEFKTITIDSLVENKKDIKILDVLDSKRKYNKFLKEKLWIVQKDWYHL